MAVIDASDVMEHESLLTGHGWLLCDPVTISGLLKLNRDTCGDCLDVLNGLIEAGINLYSRLDWTVRAVVFENLPPIYLELARDSNDKRKMTINASGEKCVCLVLKVCDGEGRLITYLEPHDLKSFGQTEWVPSWCYVDRPQAKRLASDERTKGDAMSDKPKRIQRKRTKGYRLPQRATCVAGNAWRNPFETVAEFRTMMTLIDDAKGEIEAVLPHMHQMLWIYNNVHLLKGFDLAGDDSLDVESHVDVLLEYANR